MGVLRSAVFVMAVTVFVAAPQTVPADLEKFLRAAGRFGDTDLAALAAGQILTRIERGTTGSEVAVLAAIRIRSARERTAQYYGQFISYVDGQVTLGFDRFSRPAVLSDVKDLSLDRAEIDAIRSCRPGNCDLRLPGTAIEALRSKIDWKAADVDARVNLLVRQAAVDYVNAYLARGDDALVTYADRRDPVSLKEQWRSLLSAAPVFHQYSPALAGYLAAFPRTPLAGARDVFYWIKENYGRKPVLSLVHGVVYEVPGDAGRTTIAQKQIYASHYYDGSLAVATVAASIENGQPVSYVVYGNRSRGDLLNGGFGGLRRSIAEDQARKAAEQTLAAMKAALEKD